MIPKDAHISLVIPKDAHISLVIPKDTHSSLVIPKDTHISLVIPKDAHISLVIPKDAHISLVISKDIVPIRHNSRIQFTAPLNCVYTIYLRDFQTLDLKRGWLGSSQLGWLGSNRLKPGQPETACFRAYDGSGRFTDDARRRSDDRLLRGETTSGGRPSPASPWLSWLYWLGTRKEMLDVVGDGKFTREMDAVRQLEEEGDDGWLRALNGREMELGGDGEATREK
ncbi:BCL-6 corepressor-like protein 1 [Cucumis melo var. makuwa]|uniref:BCL-6 corepressor-like protein 1 n=1 Tax=Cucumis melo var. makuwa TaxID=1194695 RepID=A0A5D3CQ86_CUCMM|nr:BCL-6 corepressor-like protein 1 [Cucumis melo var. makuwa]